MIISHLARRNPSTPIDTVLNNNRWGVISKVSGKGQAQNYWAVGDTKEITINGKVGATTFSNLSLWAFIIGFDHNSSIEGSNTIHFQIGKSAQANGKNLCLIDAKYDSYTTSTTGLFNMNYADSNSGGWKNSKMRTVLLGNSNTPDNPRADSLIAALPSDLRGVMKGVTKYSDNTGGGKSAASYITSTTDYLWLLAEHEVFGKRGNANTYEQNNLKQYDYYLNGNSKVFYRHSAPSSTALWWLRSVSSGGNNVFCIVTASGTASANVAYYAAGLAPAFCV